MAPLKPLPTLRFHFFFFASTNLKPLVDTPTLSPSSYVSLSLSQIDVFVQDASQITPLSFDVPLEAPFQTTPQSSTFDKGKDILVRRPHLVYKST
jgi:hypothetical protein